MFFDDVNVICSPERVGDIHLLLQELWRHSRISFHHGKTHVKSKNVGTSSFLGAPPNVDELQSAWLWLKPFWLKVQIHFVCAGGEVVVVLVFSFLLCLYKTVYHAPQGMVRADSSRMVFFVVLVPSQNNGRRVNSGKDPEEKQVAARHQVERLENALQALGETESTVAQGLNAALKEVRRV